jgi:hypothetical protein
MYGVYVLVIPSNPICWGVAVFMSSSSSLLSLARGEGAAGEQNTDCQCRMSEFGSGERAGDEGKGWAEYAYGNGPFAPALARVYV